MSGVQAGGIIGGCLAFFFGWAFLVRVMIRVSRPRLPTAPATPDLADTPPAVVNLMAHGFVEAPEAAAATLLDLAARRYVTLDQPGADVTETVVRVVRDDVAGLSDYEQRVLDRVTPAPGGAPFTLADLARRHAQDGQAWNDGLVEQVRADAARRGLVKSTKRKTPPAMVMLLVGLMIVTPLSWLFAAALLALIAPELDDGYEAGPPILIGGGLAALVAVTAMVGIVGAIPEQRYTPAGRALARLWGGVARWLAGQEAFAQLPPAAVTVWDRYLAHGVALGLAPVAAAAIDLRTGPVDLVHSWHGQQPRLVRVHYRRRRWLPLASPGARVVFAVLSVSALLFVLWLARGLWPLAPPIARYVTVAAVAALVSRAAYLILRTIGDALFARTVTGPVLRSVRMGAGCYVVVDDGRSVELSGWFVRPGVALVLRPGELVSIRVHPWSGTVAAVTRNTATPRPLSTVQSRGTASATSSSTDWATIGRRVAWGLFGLVFASVIVLQSFGEQWQRSVVMFDFDDAADHRIRLTGARGVECVQMEYYSPDSRRDKWRGTGKECAWPRMAGSDGWLAGGLAEPAGGEGGWIFYGIVPAAAMEVEITLADGSQHRIATRQAGDGTNRVYARHVPRLGEKVEIVGVRLRDAQGGELHVY